MKKTITTLKGVSSKLMQRSMSENEGKLFSEMKILCPRLMLQIKTNLFLHF